MERNPEETASDSLERSKQEELKLRQRIADVEMRNLELQRQIGAARESMVRHAADVIRLETERNTLEEDLERATRDLTRMESQHADLTSLYVAAMQLHGSLKRSSVLNAIQEIVINLIGSEEFGVFEHDEANELRTIAHVGMRDTCHPEALDGVTAALDRGEPFVATTEENPVAAYIPLKIEDQLVGCIAIYRLLPHKGSFQPIDLELFNLLTTHAASALVTTRKDGKADPKGPAE